MSNLPLRARYMAKWLETRPNNPIPASAPMLLHQCADRIEKLEAELRMLDMAILKARQRSILGHLGPEDVDAILLGDQARA